MMASRAVVTGIKEWFRWRMMQLSLTAGCTVVVLQVYLDRSGVSS